MTMTWGGGLELVIFVGVLALLVKPVGGYLYWVLEMRNERASTRVLGLVERLFFRISHIDLNAEQTWKQYTRSLLVFSLVATLFTYAILRLQHLLPLNPQHFGPMRADLAFNTAASFATNTNWQNYGGESTLSYFSQMVGLVLQNFASAAVGIAVAAAFVRGIVRQNAKTIGHFWRDLVRIHLYVLIPLSLIFAVFLVSQGVVQNFRPYRTAIPVETSSRVVPPANEVNPDASQNQKPGTPVQKIVQGPIASQEAIKIAGTNGGGYTNANSAHPFENPTPLANFIQILLIFLIASGLTSYLGRMTKNPQHGWAVWTAMMVLFLAGLFAVWAAESAGNPRLRALGIDPAVGNLEGKEVRFGIFDSVLFATVTTDASCGAVNSMHDSYTPLGGLVPLLNIQLGEVIFGGVGSGLYGMLAFIVLAVFLAGLMVGRTPEYLGKKIQSGEVKLCVIALLVLIFDILGFAAWASASAWGRAGVSNAGPHGLSELLYAFSSASGNNGSAFAGLNANKTWFNTTLGVAMLIGRFLFIVPVLALAGRLARKKRIAASAGTFPVTGALFVVLLVATVLVVGALTFFPALSLGPVLEHFMMMRSNLAF
jgi:K+-transporting ATPase ATPase A chain